ncbi:Lactation elevated protein 1 [Hordeum vulgare]|nr:Lactation elevated protein 1 [Hordeum vulgare]
MPSHKQQGNVVVQGNISAGLARRGVASAAADATRSARPSVGKMSKVSGVKWKKVPTKKPLVTSSAPAIRSPTTPFYGAASTIGKVSDERAGSGISNNATAEFVNLLATNVVDIDQAPIAGFNYDELEGGVDDHGGHSKEKVAQQWHKDMDAAERKSFKLEDCWELLKNCDKWALIDKESPPKRGSFTDMDEDEDDDGPRNLNNPDGDKKTKEKIKREHEASTLRDNIDSMLQSNEVLLAKSLETKIELTEKKAQEKQERWKLLKEVEERKAHAAENKTTANLLAEENRIMTLNCNDMDDISKEWHDMTRREILKRRMLACYNGGDGFSSRIETDDFGAGVGTNVGVATSAGDGFRGVDGFEGGDDLNGAD